MKYIHLIAILLATLCGLSACDKNRDGDKTPDSGTTQLGERTCSGTITMLPSPPTNDGPPLPGLVLGLQTADEAYILTCNGHWQTDGEITVGGTVYTFEVGDTAEATGMASKTQLSGSEAYLELEISTIKKTESIITPVKGVQRQ